MSDSYPTRNFATLGTIVTSVRFAHTGGEAGQRGGHLCHPPHVAMRVGLYLRRLFCRCSACSLCGFRENVFHPVPPLLAALVRCECQLDDATEALLRPMRLP